MIETRMGLDVADNDGYQAYRDAMLPLLERIEPVTAQSYLRGLVTE